MRLKSAMLPRVRTCAIQLGPLIPFFGLQKIFPGQMLDVVPPMPLTLTPNSDTYSPDGRNAFGANDQWVVGEDDNVGRSRMWGLSACPGPVPSDREEAAWACVCVAQRGVEDGGQCVDPERAARGAGGANGHRWEMK